MVDAMSVLNVLLEIIPVQEASLMQPPADVSPPLHNLYRTRLGADVVWHKMERWAFYEKIASPRTSLMIATGEQERFSNLLLEIGVVKPSAIPA